MNGPHNMWTGFGRSVNTYFVPLQEKVGAENVDRRWRKRLGIHVPQLARTSSSPPTETPTHLFGPFTLGVTDTVPLELANAYATVAADGKYCEPMPVVEILDNKGNKLRRRPTRGATRWSRPEVARAAIDAARCPIDDTRRPRQVRRRHHRTARSPRHRSATRSFGKTGTSDHELDRQPGHRDQAAGGRGHRGRPGLRPDDRTTMQRANRSTRRRR